ncbi:DUF4465 domain-containing protein [Bacteroidales bacterium OttesenSCG-928-L03]|nr:DUF4465 domain-containing protein [Bacteroidales bacterium OttesenSCG-928-L03]
MRQRLYSLWVVAVAIIGVNVAQTTAAQSLQVATFEDLVLEPSSFWYYDAENKQGSFTSGSFTFSNFWNDDYGYVYSDGFYYSNLTLSIPDSTSDYKYYASVVGKGANGSDNYAAYTTPYGNTGSISLKTRTVVPGLYLTNSLYAYSSITNGDTFAGDPFAQGDYFLISFMNQPVESDDAHFKRVDFYLADYRSPNTAEHYILTDWQWLDLSPLGEVDSIFISFDASRKSYGYLSTPTYVCLDNVGASNPYSDLPDPAKIDASARMADGVLYISGISSQYGIRVFSPNGSIVYNKEKETSSEINAGTWANGIYLVELRTEGSRTIKKVIKK